MRPPEATILFESLAKLREGLLGKLVELARMGEPGFLVTALNNALVMPRAFAGMEAELKHALTSLLESWRERIPTGEPITGRPDEVDLLLRLALVGWGGIRPVERRAIGPWSAQFNVMRAMRPRLASLSSVARVSVPRAAGEFSFCDDRLRSECVGTCEMGDHACRVYLNRYPFSEAHLLILPDADRLLPQLLDSDLVNWAWSSITQVADRIPGAALGWNALGAHGSVNHAHFQMVVEPEGLPICHPRWSVNGGPDEYPAAVTRHHAAEHAWAHVGQLQADNVPFNMLYVRGAAYVFPRAFEGTVAIPTWSTGFAFYELSGCMIVTRSASFASLADDDIVAELSRIGPRSGSVA